MRVCDGCGKEVSNRYVILIGGGFEILFCSYNCFESCYKKGNLKKVFKF